MVMCSSTTNMTDTHKTRRSNKPMMERRRRERINQCLDQLKTLVLTAQRKDPTRYSKLEKADILEMTVRHVQTLQRQDPTRGDKYRAGFTQCAAEVAKFLSSVNGLPADLHCRVLSHLAASPPAAAPPTDNTSVKSESPKVKTLTVSVESVPPTNSEVGDSPRGDTLGGRAPSDVSTVPVVGKGQVALVLPHGWGVTAGGTSPTTPDAAGAPSSPESARGSSPSSPPSLSSPQLAPLDLATPHRRSVEMAPSSHIMASSTQTMTTATTTHITVPSNTDTPHRRSKQMSPSIHNTTPSLHTTTSPSSSVSDHSSTFVGSVGRLSTPKSGADVCSQPLSAAGSSYISAVRSTTGQSRHQSTSPTYLSSVNHLNSHPNSYLSSANHSIIHPASVSHAESFNIAVSTSPSLSSTPLTSNMKPKVALLPRPVRCQSVRHSPYPAPHLHPHWRPW
ncbi:hypothetical protein Pmani_037622 [Petrolisthes manimaculis]|uniref:Uncharacterized protein n=1 Tax=Petrolisthes manimaculis TaxID=1843537 RepID=A0AAE1NG02_9EUCA|nr:hypothetical protein Pmani_037622 [Petrolisthes manimaculis]